jgi:hypothetical protein
VPCKDDVAKESRLLCDLAEGRECVEHGYLMLPAVNRELAAGNREAAYAAAMRMANQSGPSPLICGSFGLGVPLPVSTSDFRLIR